MIAILVTKPVDYAQRYACAQAQLRVADTSQALDRAIDAIDAACAKIVENAAMTRADIELRLRALEWVRSRQGFIKNAHAALDSRQLYRDRRVAADRPYARKAKPQDRRAS